MSSNKCVCKQVCNILICMQKHSQHNNDERNTVLEKKYTSHTLFEMVGKGYEKDMCGRWVGDWTKTATYWLPALLAIAALHFHPVELLNQGPWGPSSLLGLVLSTLNSNNWLQPLISNSLELPVAPGYIIVWHPTASVSVASTLNSTRPYLRPEAPVIYTGVFLIWNLSRVGGLYVTSVVIVFYSVKWLQLLLFTLIILFNINYLFAHSEMVAIL